MEHTSPPGAVLDAGDDDFDEVVIERSRTVPVLVDFWAPWCGPCRVFGPVLEKVGRDLAGQVEIVKVNTDDHRRVATRYRISSIPAVKLFEDGEVRAELVGAHPEPRVRAFLEEQLPTGAIRRARAGAEEELYAGEHDRAIELAKQVPASSPDWERTQAILELAESLREPPPSDDAVGDAYVAALSKLLERDAPGALDGLLAIDATWANGAARRAALAVARLLGVQPAA